MGTREKENENKKQLMSKQTYNVGIIYIWIGVESELAGMKDEDLKKTLQMHLEEDEKLMKLILITFNNVWNILLGFQTYAITILVTYVLAFKTSTAGIFIWILISDLVFLADFTASVLYKTSAKMRRFLPFKTRDWRLLLLDFISLIPMAYAYETYISSESKDDLITLILLQGRCLRVYRVFMLLNVFDLTSRDATQYFLLLFIRFLTYVGLASHILACIWVNLPHSQPCDGEEAYCIVWHESNTLLLLIEYWFGNEEMFNTYQERLLTVATLILGYVIVYGDFIPHLLLVFMRISKTKGHYFQNYLKLERYLKNISVDSALNEKIKKYFRRFWQTGTTGIITESLMNDLPMALKKEIHADIYWDSLRHSDILKGVSRSCKRSLSLCMTTEYCQEGDLIFEKGRIKGKMIYLVQGILELMAEENAESPIMSFSNGTILGEMTLFTLIRSPAIVKCRTLCEIHTLTLRNVHRVLLNYPEDRSLVFQKLNKRLVIAKITQWRKKQIMIERIMGMDMGMDMGSSQGGTDDNEDCVKWVKAQWRGIWEAHERHILIIKAIEGGLRIPAWRKQHEIQYRLDTVSNYMDLMVLSDILEEKKDVVCLRTVFPWAIDPEAEFLIYWKILIVITAIFTSITYPFCSGWLDDFPEWVLTISNVFSLFYQVDVALMLMTAVKKKHGIMTKFSYILINCLKKPTFYMDILAAMPYQVYVVLFKEGTATKEEMGLLLLLSIFKAHVFLKPRTEIGKSMVEISLIKNVFIFLLLLYWLAVMFQLLYVRCVPYCGIFQFQVLNPIYEEEYVRRNFLSVFVALAFGLSIPDQVLVTEDYHFLIVVTLTHVMFFFASCFFMGDFYTVYSIKISNRIQFKKMFDRINKYIEATLIGPLLERRITDIVRFQWRYNQADDMLTKVPMVNMAPKSLRREIYAGSIFQTLRKCPLFEFESNDFLYDVIDKCDLIAVPAGTILVNYGMQCYNIHMIHKGYCQLNSFLRHDVTGGLGTAVLIKPGHVFPTLGAFITAPVPISVFSLTDCEIMIISLEDLLRTMITHNTFRDLVSVLHDNSFREKLSDHMLAMVRVNVQFNQPPDKRAEFVGPYEKLGFFGKILMHLTLNKDLYFDQNQKEKVFLKTIRVLYIMYLILLSLVWPLCFGLLMYQSHILFPIFFACKIFPLVYMYIQLHVPYFDKRGLLITHPLHTMCHYLTTSFLLDILINFPHYSIYHYFIKPTNVQDSPTIVCLLILQKMLSLIPINGFFNDLTRESKYVYLLRPMKFFLILSIIINALANFEMFTSVNYIYAGNNRIIGFTPSSEKSIFRCRNVEENDVLGFYMAIIFWMFGYFTTNKIYCENTAWEEQLYAQSCSLVGTIATYIFFGWLASHSDVSDTRSNIYQERMKSFLEFLLDSKTDDKIVESSVGYFEHQYSRSRGQNLKEICDNLPRHLHEELAYPLYRPTLRKIGIFENADEGFYRTISTSVDLVHFNRGSVIFFKGQVQSDIFFVHRGKCFVFDWFITLDIGSMIGDLDNSGHVENKVYALTHVELLRIDSLSFTRIINNFYEIERLYKFKVAVSENFIKSKFVPASKIRPVDSRDVLNAFNLQTKDLGFEDQSYFEDPENITSVYSGSSKQVKRRHRMTYTIYPGTYPMLFYNLVYLTVAFVTAVVLPWLFFFGPLTWFAFITIGSLDALWFITTLIAFRVGIEDKIKGDIITDSKFLVKDYIQRWDGFFISLVVCIPFDLIPVFVARSLEETDLKVVSGLRSLRLLRGYYLVKYLHSEVNKLKVRGSIRYASVIIYFILLTQLLVLFFLAISSAQVVLSAMKPLEFGEEQWLAILIVYQHVLNIMTSANMTVIPNETKLEMIYFSIVTVFSIYVKGLTIKHILSLKYIQGLARSKYKDEVATLENYLKRQDLSPSILQETMNYKLNLLIATRSESMPTFLLTAPNSLQMAIMTDLYLPRLLNSPIFRDVEQNFLRLLVCRLKREMFFPGQKIVEKGDVDNTMYFVHRGEVYLIDETDEDAYIEYVLDRIHPGDQFGEAQGLTLARPHKYTYRARTVVEMLTLNSKDWFDLRLAYPDMHEKIIETAKNLQYD